MTIRNLDVLFDPRSIALIGASARAGSVGSFLAKNLFHTGFEGPIMPVNPKYQAVEGVLTYPDVASLPVVPDLAVIATPPQTIPRFIHELGARGTKAAVVITAGFGEGGDEAGEALKQEMLDAARPHLLRVVGPNCVGILLPPKGINASFAHLSPLPGDIAFATQSGAMITAVADWATPRGIGFSHLLSLGDMSDVDFGDTLDFLATDPGTRAILLYVETVRHARKFMSAARRASRAKPVIVVKSGRSAAGAAAAVSHTGSLAGSDQVYDAAFRRSGMLRVYDLDELFDAVETLAMAQQPEGDRLAILTNGGGIGVLSADALEEQGGRLAELSAETMARLNEALPSTWSHGNPVDIIGDAPPTRYCAALEALLEEPGADGVLVLNVPSAVTSSTDAAFHVAQLAVDQPRCVMTSWVGVETPRDARRIFSEHHIPTYDTPSDAVRAFMQLVRYRRVQQMLTETPPSVATEFSPDTERARAVIRGALADGIDVLTEPQAKELLRAYEIPTVPTRVAADADEAARIAAELGSAVAVKILSPDITHKSDVGGVKLDLATPQAVKEIASEMAARIVAAHPEARIDGFTVSPMVRRPGAYELIVGMVEDVQFGPYVLFGHGGTAVEVIEDTAIALPPLNTNLARDVIRRTRIYRQLRGFRDRPPVDLDAVALTLMKVSQLVVDIPEVVELDINPLLADDFGVLALDARVAVRATDRPASARLAIRPYPKELEQEVEASDGRRFLVRPISPEDEPALVDLFTKLTPEEVRMRFREPLAELPRSMSARLSQLDYDREMGLALCDRGTAPGGSEIYGVARFWADPDLERAESAIVVRSDVAGLGIGSRLLQQLIDYARLRGIRELYADTLPDNERILKLVEGLGFVRQDSPAGPALVRVTLAL